MKTIKFILTFLLFINSFKKFFLAIQTEEEILNRISSIINNKDAPLLAGGLAIIKDNKTIFCKSLGKSRLNPDLSENKTANEHTKYRTASISKLFTAIAIWQLEEKGLLNINDEASKYLNFDLRNPNFPDIPITIGMLLSHTSSIREGNYNVPYNHNISEFFTNDSEIYYNNSYSKENPPGYYSYVNMNYCLLGTIIENVSKERFDKYMINHILEPLNITGSFNIYEMSQETLDETGTLYEKLTNGNFDINGKWIPRMDDFSSGYPQADYSEYIIGTNGALHGPMGNLRISITELTYLVHMFLNNGTYNNNVILKKETIEKMFEIIWKYDKNNKNGDDLDGYDYAYAGGPSIITNVGKNRLHEHKNLNFSVHTADAYGLFGGVFFDRIKGYGVVYRGNGVSRNLEKYIPSFSAYNKWALEFIKLADNVAQFDYPINYKEDNDDKSNSYIIYIIIALIVIILFVVIFIVFKTIKNKNKNNAEVESNEPLMK